MSVLTEEPQPVLRGERVKARESYDLFGSDVKNKTGIYLKTDEHTGKYLIYFPFNGEWAELPANSVDRLEPGSVSEEDQEFITRVKTLVYTLEI